MEIREKTNRVHIVDFLKTLAMFFVLFYHGLLLDCDFLVRPGFATYFNFFFISILSTGVPLFFFCNGFIMLNRPLNLKKHIIKTVRLVIITTIWAFLTVALMCIIDKVDFSFIEYIKAVINLKSDMIGYFWFMGSFVCLYLLFPVIKGAFDSNKASILYFAIISFIIPIGIIVLERGASAVVHDFGGIYFRMFDPFNGINAYPFVYFCLGGLAGFYQPKIESFIEEKHIKAKLISCIMIIVSCACLSVYGILKSRRSGEIWDMVFASYDSIFTLVNVFAIFILSLNYKPEKDSLIVRIIRYIGMNTLGIYLIHELFIHMLRGQLYSMTWCKNIAVNSVYALALIFASLAVAWVIKKIPLLKHIL